MIDLIEEYILEVRTDIKLINIWASNLSKDNVIWTTKYFRYDYNFETGAVDISFVDYCIRFDYWLANDQLCDDGMLLKNNFTEWLRDRQLNSIIDD